METAIFLFGDQTSDFRPYLLKLLRGKNGMILDAFLAQAAKAIRQEIALQRACSSGIPEFTTILELVEGKSSNTTAHPACMLAAATISLSSSLLEFLALAVESVKIAFRLGFHVSTMGERLSGFIGQQSWSSILCATPTTVQNALDRFYQRFEVSTFPQVWISATSIGSVTITGFPAAKKRFLESLDPQQILRADATVYGPYHAPHIFTEKDLDTIIPTEANEILTRASPRCVLHSSITGEEMVANNGRDLIHECLREMLLETIHWENVVEACSAVQVKVATVVSIGPSNLAPSMVARLKARRIEVTSQDLSSNSSTQLDASDNCPIAIVGMAGRFPDAEDHEALWQILEKGRNVCREVPPDRFDVKTHTDPLRKNTSYAPYGNFVEKPGLFDAAFFNMSPREATQTDPMQRLMLMTAYEAMEMGGIVPGSTSSTKHDRIGTFYGQTSDDWREINAAQNIDTYFIPGGVRAFGPGRINYFFKFSGPSFSIDTACSSSFAAIHVACNSLKARECDTALAGGANIMTNPDIFAGLSKAFFLSKTGSCKTFDDSADGYCRGDGVATVILKRLDDAVLDRDRILGVIRGIKTNHSASATSITHPSAKDQVSLFSSVLNESRIDPQDVNYVEMHGTGTQAGDNTEIKSVLEVFSPEGNRRKQPLHVGSLKSNIGHGEAVSGVSALIKCLMMLQRNVIPPHCGVTTRLNKKFPDLSERNTHIAFQTTPFERPHCGKRTVFISNFSAAGGNTGLVLEDSLSDQPAVSKLDSRPYHVVTLSAKSKSALQKNVARFKEYCRSNPTCDLADLSYTTTARRNHYDHRAGFAVSSMDQLTSELVRYQGSPGEISCSYDKRPNLAFAYTGQGSQYSGMGKELYKTCNQFREDIDTFNNIAIKLGFEAFKPLIDGSQDMAAMKQSSVQLGVVCLEMALSRLWRSWGMTPSVVVGHSLGEYAALNAAGVLSEFDVIFLVGKRATLLEQKCSKGTHAMLAVKASLLELNKVLSDYCLDVACINGPSDIVLSGKIEDIKAAARALAPTKSIIMDLQFAFHSSQVDVILDEFEKSAAAVDFRRPHTPLLSPLLGQIVTEKGIIGPSYLRSHCRNTVDFVKGLDAGASAGYVKEETLWLEIGCRPICSRMIKTLLSSIVFETLSPNRDPWDSTANTLCGLYNHGITPNFAAYHGHYSSKVLQLPTYAFDEKVYWLQYTGDWCLTKNQASAKACALEDGPAERPFKTSVQRIISESIGGQKALVKAESDLGSPLLHKVVAGHLVAGKGLCPSSLYADMALALTEYAYSLIRPNDSVTMNVGSMENPAPLILQNTLSPEPQLVQMEVSLDREKRNANFHISTMDGKVVHAKCKIYFEKKDQLLVQWDRVNYMVKDRIDMLKSMVHAGNAEKLGRSTVYKIFGALVTYSDQYQGMKDVVLRGEELEGTSEIRFRASPESGNFHTSPYLIDSAAHLAGFIMNASADANTVYISHGWESLCFPEGLDHSKPYTAYVKMRAVASEKRTVAGDVYIFDSEYKIIGLVSGLKFQAIPKTLLNSLLERKTVHKASNPVPQGTPAFRNDQLAHTNSSHIYGGEQLPVRDDFFHKVIRIIAKEIDMKEGDLGKDTQWADIGVDSLMCLAICGKLRDYLDLDLPSSLFTEFPTVRLLKEHLLEASSGSSTPTSLSTSSSLETTLTTPDETYFGERPETPLFDNIIPIKQQKTDVIATVKQIIAEQTGVQALDIDDNTDLATIGLDSLMTLAVSSVLRETCQIDVPAFTFAASPTLGHLRAELGLQELAAPRGLFQQAVGARYEDLHGIRKVSYPPAVSHLLQGDPETAKIKIFLFPDGSGSATSYMSIPAINPEDICIYGLDCPFMKDPASYTIGINGVSKLYLEEIYRRQPKGPYYLGGWSAGGIVAYEVAQQLATLANNNPPRKHEFEVAKLIMIDSPCPIDLKPLPTRLHQFFADVGIIGSNSGHVPSWLIPHFESSIKNLSAYRPQTLLKNNATSPFTPETLFIWATLGVYQSQSNMKFQVYDSDPENMKWLLENRTDFGSNGWHDLLPIEHCRFQPVEGANHFTMMKSPNVEKLAEIIRQFLHA
ncbi:putative polyketide synthase [Phaeomoniella chlamydospora]|uniref:Putative polyketide synthase n=1 Tax=Phaeomoniella chlamydospora TaxID=158046 RepID=A0A0G2ETF9_PHACM|nr:putative polyketide synthase [Phaeomoniella chlamydospora]